MSPRRIEASDRRGFLRLAGCTLGSAVLFGTTGTGRASEAADWRFDTGAPVFSSPTVVDGTVYTGSQSGAVYALDAKTGRQRWKFETDEPVDSSPFVIDQGSDGDTADRLVLVGCDDTNLYAIDAATGEAAWRIETNGRIQGSPVVGAETLFVTSDNDGLYAVDTTDTEANWVSEYQTVSYASPTVIENTVFVRGEKLRALDPQSGWQRWQFDLGSGTYSSPTVANGTVYVGDRERNDGPNSAGNLYGIDVESGEQEWVFDTDEFIDSSPTVAEETVYVGGWKTRFRARDEAAGTGSVFALGAESGKKRWQFETDGRVLSSPTVADGIVYVGSWDGSVYGLDAVTGDERLRLETGGRVSSSPTVEDGRLFVGCNDGHVYALSTENGGTSNDSRVELGTLGHTESKRLPDDLRVSSRLDGFTARALGTGGAVGLLAGSGLLYWGEDQLDS